MSATRKAVTVLVADDDEDDRGFIQRAWLTSRGLDKLRFVEDGEELIDYLYHTGKYSDLVSAPRPAVILLDLNMPRKSGPEALQEIKAAPELRQIPIIVLTTSRDQEDIDSSYDLGASSYIVKPRTFGALVQLVKVLGTYWIDIAHLPTANVRSS